jgi:hypothetical protein
MGIALKASLIPRGILMGGASYMTELNVIRSRGGVNVQWEHGFEKLMRIVPIQLGLKIDPLSLGPKPKSLCDLRIHIASADAEAGTAAVKDGGDLGGIVQLPLLIPIIILDLPSVIFRGMIGIDRQNISPLSL